MEFGVPVTMMERIYKASAAYEGKFRDLEKDLRSTVDFASQVMKQDPI